MRSNSFVLISKIIDIILDYIEKVFSVIIGMILFIITVINFIEVVNRVLGRGSIYWAHELTILLICWLTFLGIGIVFKHKAFAAVEMFVNIFNTSVKRIIKGLAYFITIFFMVLIIYRVIIYLPYQQYQSAALEIPVYFFSFPLIIGLVTIILCFFNEIIKSYTACSKK